MKAAFFNDNLDYMLVDGKKCSIYDKNGKETPLFEAEAVKHFVVDDLVAHIVFDAYTPPYDDKTLYYHPLSKYSTSKLVKSESFGECIDAVAANEDYVFVSHDKSISILPNNFNDSPLPLDKIVCKNAVTCMTASSKYFIFADGTEVHVYDGKTLVCKHVYPSDDSHGVKHSIKFMKVCGNVCIVISSKTTLIHILSLTDFAISPPVRLGYLWRNIRSIEMTEKVVIIISDKTLHVLNFNGKDVHQTIDLSNINTIASRVIGDKVYILDDKNRIHECQM